MLEEIREVKRIGYKYVYFIDELFNRDSADLRQLLNGLTEIGIAWGCQCHPDTMTAELLAAMKLARCENIEYGLETLSPELSRDIKKLLNPDGSLTIINSTAEESGKIHAFIGSEEFDREEMIAAFDKKLYRKRRS